MGCNLLGPSQELLEQPPKTKKKKQRSPGPLDPGFEKGFKNREKSRNGVKNNLFQLFPPF